MKIYKIAQQGARESLVFQDIATQSIAEASLLQEDFVPNTKGMYFFNRLKSNRPGRGGGTKVLKQLLDYSEQVGIPILNVVSAYGNLSQKDLISFYKKNGFVPFSSKYGDDLLVYYPKSKVWKSENI